MLDDHADKPVSGYSKGFRKVVSFGHPVVDSALE